MDVNNDLISRSALQKQLMSYTGMYTEELGFAINLDAVLSAIGSTPAVDAESVRHGRWIWADDGYLRCSKCTQKAPTITQYQDEPIQTATSYCPNCGARMDAEVE